MLTAVALAACVALAMPGQLRGKVHSRGGDDCGVPDSSKSDCGYIGVDQQQCEGKGCCWKEASHGSKVPWCFHPASGPVPPSPTPPSPPTPPPPPKGAPPFSKDDMAIMWGYFSANLNIDGTGAVVAAPDDHTPGGSYYYHWARDAALTMNTVLTTIPDSGRGQLDMLMRNYTKWVHGTHHVFDKMVDSRIEPKFNIRAPTTGQPYDGAWCRPQNDAPGLRAITLIGYANTLLGKKGDGEAYVKQMLWTGDDSVSNGGVIKYDLDWLVDNWQSSSCDLWEEIESNDFFWNRFTMRKAMFLAASFAKRMGDKPTADIYAGVAGKMGDDVTAHYNGHFIQEAPARQKDGAVICALNDGYNDDGVFAPSSYEVAQTIAVYNDMVRSIYPINVADDNAGLPGILYGRYDGDTYGGGNPWVLTSACLAQLFYRGATEIADESTSSFYVHDDAHVAAWLAALPQPPQNSTFALNPSTVSRQALAGMLASSGDGVLARIRNHTAGNSLHQPEQLDKNTGEETSATDLTWSYATILKAMKQREQTMRALAAGSH